MDTCEERLGQILVNEGKVSNADIQSAFVIQKKNDQRKPLGEVLLELNLISKDDLISALNKQLQNAESGKRTGFGSCDDEGIKKIAEKNKESEYFNDLNELISVITHKIRNPLAGISAAVEVLKEKSGANESNERFFKMIFKEIDRLENVVKNIFKTFSNK